MVRYFVQYLKGQQIDRYIIILLLIGGFYSIGLFLSNTFVNIYLWRQTNDYMTIALYNLSIFIFQPITFLLAGSIAKKYSRVTVLRLGVIFLALFFIAVLLLKEQAATYNVLLGGLLGIGYGFYWLAFNVLTFEITEPDTRDFFNSFLGSLESLAGMIGPVLAGAIIVRLQVDKGYMTIFSISLTLFVLAVICSFFLTNRSTEGKYDLLVVFKQIRINKRWKYTLLANMFQGVREGVFSFVIAIWIFVTTNSEFALGMFHLLLNSGSFLFSLIVLKIVKQQNRLKAILLGGIILSFAVWLILFNLTYERLLIYALIIGIAYPIIHVPFQSMSYDVIGKGFDAKNLRIEYIVLLEIFVHIGKVAAVLFFIVLYKLITFSDPIPFILAICSVAYLNIYFFMRKIHL